MIKVIDLESITTDYNRARTRLILLDYDGTLIPFDHDHRTTTPDKHVITLLSGLAADTGNHVMLISGRDRGYLESYFKNAPITLVAEHGGYYKSAMGSWNTMFVISMNWIPQTLVALQALVFHYEGSYVEQKTFSVAWHYRKIADRITESDKHQILTALNSLPEHEQFVICDNEYTIELRTPGIDKGSFISRWVGSRYFDFIMSIGDSRTDEDLFKILRDDAYTIKVGKPEGSSANFYIESQEEVLPFLRALLDRNKSMSESKAVNGLEVAGKLTT